MFKKDHKSLIARFMLILILTAGILGVNPVNPVFASAHTVTTINDSGAGSLRQAVADAVFGDTITFASALSGQTILLSTEITINKSITIDGASLDTDIQITGSGTSPVFYVNMSFVNAFTLKDLNIINGGYSGILINSGSANVINVDFANNSNAGSYGGAIWNRSGGTLNITNCLFSGNSSGDGGAIYNEGTLTTNTSVFTNNSSSRSGGAIYNANRMTINQSTFSTNNANWDGGAIYTRIGSDIAYANIVGSSIVDNSAGAGGGGISNEGGSFSSDVNKLTITNTTISSNTNTGISSNGGFLIIKNSTIVNNTRSVSGATGSGLNIFGPMGLGFTASISNSIFANNTNGPDCYTSGDAVSLVSIGNLIENNGSGVNACGAPAVTADPQLSPLADNGGPTKTMALMPGSPAIDAGDDANCRTTDQRGVTRPQGSHCDIGAYEYSSADVNVTIAGNSVGTYTLDPGERTSPRYGINGGPVHVVSTNGKPIFTSQRAIYGSSFNSIVGYPGNQLTTEYWFTSLDDLGMITYLVIGNPSTTLTAHVDVYIAGNKMNPTPYAIAPGQRVFPRYGINGGPVQVVSDIPIFTSERTKYGNSFNEVLGYPANQLTTEYWFTSLDDLGMITYLVIGNPSTVDTALVDVYIAGNKMNTTPYSIAPGQRVFPRYGINGGPVQVVSTNGVSIFTSERTKYGNSFNEVLGYPDSKLTTTSWFTSLDDAGMITYLVIGNPSTTLTAHVDVYIAGSKMNPTPYAIAPGQRVFPRYGINGGPVQVVSDIPIFTSERSKYQSSFNEILGIPNTELTTDYWFTSLDDLGMATELVIAAP